jgi:hypothetical protein
MTAHRAAAQAETEVTRAQLECLLGGTVPRQARRRGHVRQPEACRALAPRPESVAVAREFTRVVLSAWGMTAVSDDAELVVSELVTNALRHAMSGSAVSSGSGSGSGTGSGSGAGSGTDEPVIRLRLLAHAPYLMIMVADPSREIPLRRESGPDEATGRGLHVIESCSSRWGWHLLDEGGKVVWALLPRE